MNGLSNPYTTIPLQSDSLKSAYYLNAIVTDGSANDKGHDNIFSFQTNFSASNNFKNFQAHYGIGLVIGNYNLHPYNNGNYSATINPQILNQHTGGKFFGAVGFNGGMDVVIPFSNKGEWRVIGFETSMYKEFGDYLSVRKQLPDSAATFINRSNSFTTLGCYTEIVGKTKSGSIGIKFSGGIVPAMSYQNVKHIGNYGYLNFTLATTVNKWSPYFQIDFAPKASSALLGVSLRLGK